MTMTRDLDSLTNSAMMAFEKEMRKNGVAMNFHPHYVGFRAIVRAQIAMMLATPTETHDDTRSQVPVLPHQSA